METSNGSFAAGFVLLGLTTNCQMQKVLFCVFLLLYTVTLIANAVLIIVGVLEPRLHTPMYFFLVNLSILDILYSSAIIPNMLVHFLLDRGLISFYGCAAQMLAYLILACTESLLLTVMAFDRYAAICFPLHYPRIMSLRNCLKTMACCWLTGCLLGLLATGFTLQMPLCGRNVINHFFCEATAVLKMACVDTVVAETVIFSAGVFILLIPAFFILVTYVNIIIAILKISCSQGRSKAFATCSSHLTIVIMVYGTAIFMYMKPVSRDSADQEKMVSIFYTVAPSILNPIIYSLRNKEILMALRNLTKRHTVA